jgi:signal peptidase I
MPDASDQAQTAHETSIKETLISLLISFVMALVFRSYVVEAFIIPTGSMAPTLMGAHIRFTSPQSGHTWPVNPWYYADQDNPFGIQGPGGEYGLPTATDPMSTNQVNSIQSGGRPQQVRGFVTAPETMPLSAGDRILVQKYLYRIFEPSRFDVVVFKNPELATQNYIKRLIGLPNEQVWLAAGDVFTRSYRRDAAGKETVGEWKIARKPARVQNAVWRRVFSSEYAPLDPVRDGKRWFITPWTGEEWQTQDRREYRCDTAAATKLSWDSGSWPVTCWEPYNEFPGRIVNGRRLELFPVSDLRMAAGVKPDKDGLSMAATIIAQGHEFQGAIENGKAILRMRAVAPGAEGGLPWTELGSAPAAAFAAGKAVNVEFRHADQSLELALDGRVAVRAEYAWGPADRLAHATGIPSDEIAGLNEFDARLNSAATYSPARPRIAWSFSGSPLTLYRVELDRDIYYEAVNHGGDMGLATHPRKLATLGHDQFFTCGDNSASSQDGRLWRSVDPWVADQIDPTVGIVPRDLMLGKAFFVYFPSIQKVFGRIPVPDFGRMRMIR